MHPDAIRILDLELREPQEDRTVTGARPVTIGTRRYGVEMCTTIYPGSGPWTFAWLWIGERFYSLGSPQRGRGWPERRLAFMTARVVALHRNGGIDPIYHREAERRNANDRLATANRTAVAAQEDADEGHQRADMPATAS